VIDYANNEAVRVCHQPSAASHRIARCDEPSPIIPNPTIDQLGHRSGAPFVTIEKNAEGALLAAPPRYCAHAWAI
jgi:hypothetical protein